MKKTNGLHIVGDLRMCDSQYLFKLDMDEMRKKISQIVKKNKLKELGNYYHRFGNNSFTGVIAISESHISVHTWPELGVVNMDVYTCNYARNNAEATRRTFSEIAALFRPGKIDKKEIKR